MKREFQRLQELGEQLLELGTDQLAQMNLDDALLAAVSDAKKMRSHGALRRQKQLIGKLMRSVDPAPIRAMLAEFGRQERIDKAVFRRAEYWRDRIAGEGSPALQAFFAETGDDEEIAALLRELGAMSHEPGRRRLRRRLFRAIHHRLADRVQTD